MPRKRTSLQSPPDMRFLTAAKPPKRAPEPAARCGQFAGTGTHEVDHGRKSRRGNLAYRPILQAPSQPRRASGRQGVAARRVIARLAAWSFRRLVALRRVMASSSVTL
jgi:hypothetical protein